MFKVEEYAVEVRQISLMFALPQPPPMWTPPQCSYGSARGTAKGNAG